MVADQNLQSIHAAKMEASPRAQTPLTIPVPDDHLRQREPAWVCAFCGSHTTRADTCITCGASRPAVGTVPLPGSSHSLDTDSVFLLNPDNRAALRGSKPLPAQNRQYGCIFLVLVPMLIAGVVILGAAVREVAVWYQLESNGVQVQGEVTGRRIVEDDSDSYYIAYSYNAVGQRWTGEQAVSDELYQRLEPGMPIAVRYAAVNPSVSRLDGQNTLLLGGFLIVFALLWNLVVWALFVGILSARGREARLRREGRLLPGEVLECLGQGDSDGDYQVKLRYQFRAPDGQILMGVSSRQRNDLKSQPLPERGDSVAVLYADTNCHMAL